MNKEEIDYKVVYNHEDMIEIIKAYTDLHYWVEVEIHPFITLTGRTKSNYYITIFKVEEDN